MGIAATLFLGIAAHGAEVGPANGKGGLSMPGQQGKETSGKEPPPTSATRAYRNAAIEMHRSLALPYTNDADKDFTPVLEAHDKGAIGLADIVVQYGKDPEMRQLAEAVIESRRHEIALMQAWRAKHP